MSATPRERFEIIGDLYYRRFHRLRPGKFEAPETGRDANSEENRKQFDNYFAFRIGFECPQIFEDAIERIAELEGALRCIVAHEDLTFAECSVAEKIMDEAKRALRL